METIGSYEIVSEVGRGGMGVVYRAYHPQTKRTVALKLLLGEMVSSKDAVERFRREVKIAAELSHPNIVTTYDAGQEGNSHFYAMEYVDGESLADVIERMKKLPVRAAFEIARQMAEGLSYAHEMGIIHRDIKPGNVLLARPPRTDSTIRRPDSTVVLATGATTRVRVVLTDFGMAREVGLQGGLTQTGTVLGTPAYMSPEQGLGTHKKIDGRTDVWAVGICLYEMLTGQPPFVGDTPFAMVQDIWTREPTPLRQIDPKIPRDAEAIIFRCLAKDPGERYPSMRELAEDIDRCLNHEPVKALPVTRLRRAMLWTRRNRAIATTALAGFLGVALTAAWAFWVGPAYKASRQRAQRARFEQAAVAAVAEEAERLEKADPETAIREGHADSVAGRIRSRLNAQTPDERTIVDRSLERYRAGPILSRAYFARKDWSMAYRFDPSGAWGVRAQIEIARRFAMDGRFPEAATILKRVRARFGAKETLPLLGDVLAETADLPGAAAAFAEANLHTPRAKLIDAILEERQSLPIPASGPRGGLVSREPMPILALEQPTLVLPFRDGRPAFEIRGGRLVPAASPLAVLDATDRIIDAVSVDIDGTGESKIVVALERPGVGGGYAVLARKNGTWVVSQQNLTNITQPVGLAVGDWDGCGAPEAVILFKWESSEHWLVRLREGRIEKFRPPGARVWAGSPIIADFGAGTELFLGRPLGIGAQAQFYRLSRDRKLSLASSTVVGGPVAVMRLPDRDLALLVEIDSNAMSEEEEAALGSESEDVLIILRRNERGAERVARHSLGTHELQITSAGNIAAGRLAGTSAVAFTTDRWRLERKKRRPEGQRLQVILGDVETPPISLALPFGVSGMILRDLDGDGESELIVATPDRLVVRGKRTGPVPTLPGAAPEEITGSEAGVLLRGVQDLFEFESFDAARDLLAEIMARFPGSDEAAESERMRVDALLRAADLDLAAADRKMKEREPAESEPLYARAMERCKTAASEAREAAGRQGAKSDPRRRLYLQAAEASRRIRDWAGYSQNLSDALAAGPGSDDDRERVSRAGWLPQMRNHIVLQGDPAGDALPFVADLPARLRRSGGGLTAMFDAHSGRHVAGVPVAYPGGALEFDMDVDLEGSVWSAGVSLGLVARDAAIDPSGEPGSVNLWLHGTTKWDLQGARFGMSGGGSPPLDRYRGRWRLSYGYVPEAEVAWLEVRDLDAGEKVVFRVQVAPDRRLVPGRYVFGFSMGYQGGDALVSHGFHPAVTSLRISRVSLRAAHPDCAIERAAPNSVRDLQLAGGERLFRGDRKGAAEFYRRALERDASAHVARVQLALCGGSLAEFTRGFDLDRYAFLLALDDSLRGAAVEEVRRLGEVLRNASEKYPGPCRALMGEFEAALEELKENDAAARYLRRRFQAGPNPNADWDWLVSRAMRTAGNELPFLIWAPGPEETPENLHAALSEAVQKLRVEKPAARDFMAAWVAACRMLLVDADQRDALIVRGQISMAFRMEGPLERDARHLAEVHPEDPQAWLLLAQAFARRKATRETLEYLEAAVKAGAGKTKLDADEFKYLAKHPRFMKLRGD